LHGAPERLHHGIVVTITNGAHGGEQSSSPEALTEGPRSILRTVVGV
jgi:hypothetical protein